MDAGAWWAAVCGVAKSQTRLHFHFSLSCIGEGNGNPLQCSCLENPRDGGAYWAAIYGVAQSRTRLKRLSNSSRFQGEMVSFSSALFKVLRAEQAYSAKANTQKGTACKVRPEEKRNWWLLFYLKFLRKLFIPNN